MTFKIVGSVGWLDLNEDDGKGMLQLVGTARSGEVDLLRCGGAIRAIRVAYPGHRDVEFMDDVCSLNSRPVLKLQCAACVRVFD